MNALERRRFFRRYGVGLTLLVAAYVLITVLRSVRADFAPEIWGGLGTSNQPAIFAWSEMAVAAGVLLLIGATIFLRNNRTAFFTALALSLGGAVLVGGALVGLYAGHLSAFAFMVLHGLGLYLPYIAIHTTAFERLIAVTRERANLGYLISLADAFGYLGYVVVMIGKNILGARESFLDFFFALSWVIAGACCLLLLLCWRYFAAHPATQPLSEPAPA
jgi:hypothetical protein